jgi:hypothetical protein
LVIGWRECSSWDPLDIFSTPILGYGGPYLLVRTYDLLSGQWHDRKLHFKIIVDYDIVEDTWMRRYGIQSLRLSTLAGGMSSIIIPAVKDCRKTRDLLNEIDHARENS